MTFTNPDFVRYAAAYGAQGARVEMINELIPTLERAFAAGGVHLISCRSTILKTNAYWSRN
jgi:acetolactate synthase-1/2/3 large subunit